MNYGPSLADDYYILAICMDVWRRIQQYVYLIKVVYAGWVCEVHECLIHALTQAAQAGARRPHTHVHTRQEAAE